MMMLFCARKVWTHTFHESCQLKVTGSVVIAIVDCLFNVVTMDGVLQLKASVNKYETLLYKYQSQALFDQ